MTPQFIPAFLDYYSEPDFYRSIRINPIFIAYIESYYFEKYGKELLLYKCKVYNGKDLLTCYISEEDYEELIGEQNEKKDY